MADKYNMKWVIPEKEAKVLSYHGHVLPMPTRKIVRFHRVILLSLGGERRDYSGYFIHYIWYIVLLQYPRLMAVRGGIEEGLQPSAAYHSL